MAYVDNLLASGEQPLRREHQHWFVLLADARYAIYAWLAAVVLIVLSNTLLAGNATLSQPLGWIVIVLVVGGLLYFAWQVLRWQNEEFVVTSRRVLQTEGVVNKRVIDSSLEKINDAILSESVFGRIFGFGDLEILTASESGISRLRMLRQADDFKRSMLEAKHELELELSGARPMPGPAYRSPSPMQTAGMAAGVAAPGGAGPGAAPVGADSPTTASAAMSADDVTRTLANLADLRDRGAISAEEYEAKKADLLRRL
ncbi:MAG TPA: PH domain-containing protein [Candidatus Limnocylindrales bacterium]|nr:PH domain-containing protein [Candidatus Limnocylindrales bacterium]